MTVKQYIYSTLLLLAAQGLSSCAEQLGTPLSGNTPQGTISGRVAPFVVDGKEAAVEGEDHITDLHACVFKEGKLVKVYSQIPVSEGAFSFQADETEGTLYVVANAEETGAWQDMETGTLTEDEWKRRTVSMKDQKAVLYFTGSLSLDSYMAGQSAPLVLTRGVARFDLHMAADEGVKLNGITLNGVAEKSFLLPQATISSPENAGTTTLTETFSEPLAADKQGLLYVYEQSSSSLELELSTTVDGTPKTLKAALPAGGIRRNAVYTLNLHRDAVQVEVDEWNDGGSIETAPDFMGKITIDQAHSQLNGAEVNETSDGLNISYLPADMTLALSSDNELEALYTGDAILSVTPLEAEGGGTVKNTFKLVKKLSPIGYSITHSELKFRRKGLTQVYDEDCITLSFEDNPVQVEGSLSFDLEGVCDYGKYVENELGSFLLPEGRELKVDCGTEDPWLKSEYDTETQSYRIIAGWRPNDPKGDGRTQVAKIIVSNKGEEKRSDNLVEEYTVKRCNWSIPVVKVQGVWWSKYNLRGNARKYADQIRVTEDPAKKAGQSLFDYLDTCTDSEYFEIVGSAYQSGRPQGLTITYADGKWYYPGFETGGYQLMSAIDKKSMAPDGFELPSKEDFRLLVWGDNVNLGVKASDGFSGANGLRGNLKYKQKTVSLNGGTMTVNHHLVFFSQSASNTTPVSDDFVWYGTGFQGSKDAAISQRYIFFATHNESGGLWTLRNNNGNWFKFETYGTNSEDKTHTIRCRKSDVLYQY